MNTTVSVRRTAIRNPLNALKAEYLRLVVLLTLGAQNAYAQATPEAFQKNMDDKASIFCKYVNILPNSKWITLGAFIFFLIGLGLFLFGGRGGNVYLMRAIGIIVIFPAAVSLAASFGIVC